MAFSLPGPLKALSVFATLNKFLSPARRIETPQELQVAGQQKLSMLSQDPAFRQSLLSQTGQQGVPGTARTQATNFSNVPAVPGTVAGGGGVGIPTRNAIGLGGDEALAGSARVFREQLARQLAGETTDINRQFGTAGRFTSGQRVAQIQEARQGARQQFGDFFAKTALERFLVQKQIESSERIAAAQIEAQGGQGRTQLFGNLLGNITTLAILKPEIFGKVGGFLKKNITNLDIGTDERLDELFPGF